MLSKPIIPEQKRFSTEQILDNFISQQQAQLSSLRMLIANVKDRELTITQLNDIITSLKAQLSESPPPTEEQEHVE